MVKKNKCRVAWQNATVTIQTRGDGGLNQGKKHEVGKTWTMSGHAVKVELTGHANGVHVHQEEEVSMVTPEFFGLSKGKKQVSDRVE